MLWVSTYWLQGPRVSNIMLYCFLGLEGCRHYPSNMALCLKGLGMACLKTHPIYQAYELDDKLHQDGVSRKVIKCSLIPSWCAWTWKSDTEGACALHQGHREKLSAGNFLLVWSFFMLQPWCVRKYVLQCLQEIHVLAYYISLFIKEETLVAIIAIILKYYHILSINIEVNL